MTEEEAVAMALRAGFEAGKFDDEAWIDDAVGYGDGIWMTIDGNINVTAIADAAIAAFIALGWQKVGPDRVVVPREPTDTMNDAARDWSVKLYGKAIGKDASEGCYRAMIEARPK